MSSGLRRRWDGRTADLCRCGRSLCEWSGPDCGTFLCLHAENLGRCSDLSLCCSVHLGCRGKAPQKVALRSSYSHCSRLGGDRGIYGLGLMGGGGQSAKVGCYRQNIHHGFEVASVNALVASNWCSWSTSLALKANSWSWASIRAFNASISSLLLAPTSAAPALVAPAAAELSAGRSSISTIQVKPCGVVSWYPLSRPLVNRRLIVWVLTWRVAAASEMLIRIDISLLIWVIKCIGGEYAVFRWFVYLDRPLFRDVGCSAVEGKQSCWFMAEDRKG